ncbi:MAG: MFS transporter [Pseudomonadales bacterium]
MAGTTPPCTEQQPTRFDKNPRVDRSLRHSLSDGITYAAMMGAAESYFAAFAVLLRATTTQVGLLAALPPLLGSFAQLASAWIGHRLGRRRDIIVFGALLQATILPPLALSPLLLPSIAAPMLILCAVIYFAGPNLGAPLWGSLMGDLVAESHRGRFFALRTRLSSLANFSALIIAGFVLEGFDTLGFAYWGFVAIFVSAAGLRLVSAWHLAQMHDPPTQPVTLRIPWHHALTTGLRSTGLLPFTLFFAAMQFAVAIAGPFFALYMLRDLEFSYVAFMFNTAASVCVQFVTLSRWGRLSDLFGNRLILVTTGLLIPLMPILWLLSTNYLYLLGVQAVSGLLWAGFALSASNYVFDLTPRDQRAALMAAHNVIAAAAIFLGASLGGWLGSVLPESLQFGSVTWAWASPLCGAMMLSAFVRMLVIAAFLPRLREVRRVRRSSSMQLMLRLLAPRWR